MNLPYIFASIDVTNPMLFYAVGFCAVLTVALSKAGFGGAVPVGIPILMLVTTPRIALGVTLPLLLIIDVWVVFLSYKKINLRLLGIMSIFGLFGHWIGWNFFDYISNDALTLFIGSVSLLTVFAFFQRQFRGGTQFNQTPKDINSRMVWLRGGFWCSIAGVSSFISVSGGIPLQIFLLPYKLERSLYLGTAATFFFLLNLTKIPLYADLGILSREIFIVSLMLIPAVPVGVFIGRKISNLLSDQQFYLGLHIMLSLVGVKLLYDVFG